MCLAVYIATDTSLPESTWDEHAPATYIERIPESEGVRRQFRHPQVYYAGSHEGCGCGFFKDGRDRQELEQCQENYAALARVLSTAIRSGARVQIFTCWEGEQTADPRTSATVTVKHLLDPGFEFQELSLLTVTR